MHAAPSSPEHSAQEFHRLMRSLLQFMNMHPSLDASPEVYALTFDGKTVVNIFNSRPGSVDVLAKLGILQNRKASDILLNLLAMNRYSREEPHFGIGIDPETGGISLWTRIALSDLNLDKLIALLTRILEKTALVRHQLGDPGKKAVSPARSHIPRNLAIRLDSNLLAGRR